MVILRIQALSVRFAQANAFTAINKQIIVLNVQAKNIF